MRSESNNIREFTVMIFYDAYRAIEELGSITIPFKTSLSSVVDVWASEVTKDPRKGEQVLRVQWAHSSTTIDGNEWFEAKPALIRHTRLAIEAFLKET